MGCGCADAGTRHGHTSWTCVVCGTLVAEGCVDVSRWHSDHIPAGLLPELRWGVPEAP